MTFQLYTYKLREIKCWSCVAGLFLITFAPIPGAPRWLTMGLPAPYFINMFAIRKKFQTEGM